MDEAVDGLTEISQWATDFSATTNNVAWYIIADCRFDSCSLCSGFKE